MLTQVDELAVSGISGVEGDAVELPSQFMENFCWEWEVLQRLTAHVDTGEPLPRALFDRMVAARHFQSGLQLLRQCEFALFDMRLHAEPGAAGRVQQVADEVSAEIAPMPQPPVPPLCEQLHAPVLRRLRRRLLRLRVGRGTLGRCLQRLRGSRRLRPGDRRALPPRHPGSGRQPHGAGELPRLSRPRTRSSTPCCGTRGWLESGGAGRLD